MDDKPTMEEHWGGDKCWYLNDKLHREDGPAIEYSNGDKSWYLKGKLHREDGPAEEWADGTKEWWLNGEEVTEEEVMGMNDKPTMKINEHGTKLWTLNGELHREDGPAIEWCHGDKDWYLNGKLVTEEEVMGNKETKDNVNSPSHYNQSGIECIDAIKASLGNSYQDYCKGNVMKYLWRYKYKNGIEDLKKAQWYLNSMIESVE